MLCRLRLAMYMMILLLGHGIGLVLSVLISHTQVTVIDSFSSSVNYLTNGLKGTVWDGVYFGSGEFDNTAGGEASTLQCDANITTHGALTVQTTGTEWEGTGDDGFFLFQVVSGDF